MSTTDRHLPGGHGSGRIARLVLVGLAAALFAWIVAVATVQAAVVGVALALVAIVLAGYRPRRCAGVPGCTEGVARRREGFVRRR